MRWTGKWTKVCRRIVSMFVPFPRVVFEHPRFTPVSRSFGMDRGTPIDRYYIEKFLEEYKRHIAGNVLEVGESTYTKKFGHDFISHVMHVDPPPNSNMIRLDFTRPESWLQEQMDCFVCTQTFLFLFDLDQAIRCAHGLLKKDGVLLATTTGIGKLCRYEGDAWVDYWHLTPPSAQRLFEKYFSEVQIRGYGNLFAAKAFLEGLALEDLPGTDCLDFYDVEYPITIGIYAKK